MSNIDNKDIKKIITNDTGDIIATIHGEINIDTLANFFIKIPLHKNQNNTRQYA